jgi:integrase
MLEIMPRIPRLQAGLLAGAGLRIESDMLTLRLKDIRLTDRVLTIYEAKGNKSRSLRIPEFLVSDLELQINASRRPDRSIFKNRLICAHPLPSSLLSFVLKSSVFSLL